MRCACIDIGSNTTRLLVAECADGRLERVHEERAFTRIGRALDGDRAIPAETIASVAEVVAAQRATAEEQGTTVMRVVATAAIRGAANQAELLAAIRARAGVEVVVLTGDDEARLAFHGATCTLPERPAGAIAVVDVGGGSTEIAVGTLESGVTWARSFPIGSSSLAASVPGDPPTPEHIAHMRARAREAFDRYKIPPTAHAIAVGGSAASLPAVVGRLVHADAVDRALRVLLAAPAAEVARRHGLAAERTHLLPAGHPRARGCRRAARPPAPRRHRRPARRCGPRAGRLRSQERTGVASTGPVTDLQQPAAEAAVAAPVDLEDYALYFNRELSWLGFDDRVLQLAEDPRVPLLERVKFCAIYSNNLDEFFMVRVAGMQEYVDSGIDRPREDGRTPAETVDAIGEIVKAQLARQTAVLDDILRPALAEHGIRILSWDEIGQRAPRRARRALPAPDLPGPHAARRRARPSVPVHLQPLALARRRWCATRRPARRPSRA